jgi:tetratricopeptide (TPR) repeat protein
MLTVACHRPVETVCTPSLQPKLIAIDTLMQSRPDSALKALYSCTDTSNVSASDRHYYQLLLSEALYKNDFAQQNRPELLDAMAYFDSIGDAFLSARCHHMNGVGYYEMDSVVAACAEYMKAVEIMESHFEERDLMEYKAKFMALAYTHLSVLFSDQYLHEQAIYFGKCALLYYNRYDAEPWHVAWIFNMIGSHDEILEKYDDAKFYYRCAIDILPDTNNMMYRDISSHLALLLYESGKNKTTPLHQLYRLANISENRTEKTIRYASIGMIYYLETQYDSAWKYLDRVYNETTNIALKKQSAEWLIEICKIQNNFSGVPFYTDYLAQFALLNETQGSVKSGLSELFLHYEKKNQELTQKNKTTQLLRVVGLIFGCSLLVFVFFCAIYIKNNKR